MIDCKNLKDAIDLLRRTYKGRTYTIIERGTGDLIKGTACDIYGRLTMDEIFGKDTRYSPCNAGDVLGQALLDVIESVAIRNAPYSGLQLEAQTLLNQIVEEEEDANDL